MLWTAEEIWCTIYISDDVNQPQNYQGIYQTTEDFCKEPISVGNEASVEKERAHAPQSSTKLPSRNAMKETRSGFLLEVAEQGKGFSSRTSLFHWLKCLYWHDLLPCHLISPHI